MSWWSAPKSPPVAASRISPPALPSRLTSADSNEAGQQATAAGRSSARTGGVVTPQRSEREAVSSLGRNRTGGGITSRSHGSGSGTQPQRKPSAIGQRRTLESNATKSVTAKQDRTSSTRSNGSGGGSGSARNNGSTTRGRAAQKIPRQRQADTTNVACKAQSPSSCGVVLQKTAATPTTKTALPAKQKSASPRELSSDSRDSDDVTMTVGSGWFDGLSSLVGLRPPKSIDLPPPTRKPTVPIPAESTNSAPARFSSAGTITTSAASPGSARKNQEQSLAESMQKMASSKASASPPSSLMPLHKKRPSTSIAANNSSPLSPSFNRLASTTKGSNSVKATPSSTDTSAKTPIIKSPTSDKTVPSLSTKSGRRRSSSSMRSNSRPPSADSSSRRPIKLISATNQPTIAFLSSRNIVERTRHGSVTTATKSTPPVKRKGRRKRHRRQISGEVIAALERDIFSGEDDDEEEDVISVKETLIEGIKTWAPSFLRSPPHFGPARTPPRSGPSGLARDYRNRRRHGACGAGFDGDRRRRRRPSTQSEAERKMQRVGRRDRPRSQSRQRQRQRQQERCSISTTQRTTSSASTETGGRTNEGNDRVSAGDGGGQSRHLSKREELERTMNTRVGRSFPPFGPSNKRKEKNSTQGNSPQSSSSPTSSPFSESKAATPTSSASPKIVKYDAPREKLAQPSPARSTESSRTAQTIQTDEETPSSTPSRLSSSDCLKDLEAGQASSSPKLKEGKTDPLVFPCDAKEEEKQRRLRARQKFYANNFAVFAHGRLTTIAPVIFAGVALILSVVAKRSTTFVTLQEPLLVSPTFDKVDRVGLVFLDLCLADEIVTRDEGSGIETKVGRDYRGVIGRSSPHLRGHDTEDNIGGNDEGFSVIGNLLFSWANPTSIEEYDQIIEDYDHDDYIFVGPSDDEFETDMAGWDEHISVVSSPKICRSIKITSSTLTDTLWHVSRTFLSLAIGFGFFLSFMLTSAAYWSTINLKPVAVGLLLTYFFQSMTFFFFDSGICRQHNCKMSSGAAAAVVASIFWFAAALGTIWMDMVFVQKKRRRERRERRRRRRERRRKRRREARAAFEAIKKKAALDLMESQHSGESVSICSALSDGDDYEEYDSDDMEEGIFRIMRDLGLDGDNSEDDEWIENDCSVGDEEEESILHNANVFSAISFR